MSDVMRSIVALLAVIAFCGAAQAQVYRCAGPDGKRLTKDREDIRVGEKCTPLSQAEIARLRAEETRPMTPKDEAVMRKRARKMNFGALCTELGRVLRRPNVTPRGQLWERVLIEEARVPAQDHGYIRERRLRIGMDECSVVAALGMPDAMNRTNTARGRSDQWVYRSKGMYVYTDNGVVRAWQE